MIIRKIEVVRCTVCGRSLINKPFAGKGQSMETLIGSAFSCTKCGWNAELKVSPHYSWLYMF